VVIVASCSVQTDSPYKICGILYAQPHWYYYKDAQQTWAPLFAAWNVDSMHCPSYGHTTLGHVLNGTPVAIFSPIEIRTPA
jgi:hypothetical protein